MFASCPAEFFSRDRACDRSVTISFQATATLARGRGAAKRGPLRRSPRYVGMAADERKIDQGLGIDGGVHHALALVPGDLGIDIADVEPRLRIDIEGRGFHQADGPVG